MDNRGSFSFWTAIQSFMAQFDWPRMMHQGESPNRDRWQRRNRGRKCHRWECWPHKRIKRKMAKRSRQINRRRTA